MLMRSRFGAALTGIRVNEQRMRSAGYSTFNYKLVAYGVAGALAGVSGLLYAAKAGFVNPELLAWEQSGDRKSVGSGKSVSVRVDLGGRRIIKKQKNTT